MKDILKIDSGSLDKYFEQIDDDINFLISKEHTLD